MKMSSSVWNTKFMIGEAVSFAYAYEVCQNDDDDVMKMCSYSGQTIGELGRHDKRSK